MKQKIRAMGLISLTGFNLSSSVIALASADDIETRIEQQFSVQKTVDETGWRAVIQDKRLDSYSIQAGDSLWDLSKSFFGDGFYWSKLWAENPTIGNPHNIEPGQNLVFMGGSLTDAPRVALLNSGADAEGSSLGSSSSITEPSIPERVSSQSVEVERIALAKLDTGTGAPVLDAEGPTFREDLSRVLPNEKLESGAVLEENEVIAKPLLPPPGVGRAELLRDLPSTFIETKPQRRDSSVTITKKERLADEYEGAIVPTTIAFTEAPVTVGTVKELLVSEAVAGFGQRILVQAKDPLNLGSKVHSVRKKFKLDLRESRQVAEVYEVEGVIVIDEIVDTENLIYLGHIVYSEGPVRIGSELLSGEPKRIMVSTRGRKNGSSLVVAGGGDGLTRRFFGDGAVIYLDRMDAEVIVGDELAIQGRLKNRRRTEFTSIDFPIAIARVFHVDGAVVSAVVVVAKEEIMVGDRTGDRFPTRLPRLSLDAPPVLE